MFSFIVGDDRDGSGFESSNVPEYDTVEQYKYSVQPIDRKRLMIALADLEYILVRATHGQAVNVVA
jgi:hypothetical protein